MSARPLCQMLHSILINCHLFMVIAMNVSRIIFYISLFHSYELFFLFPYQSVVAPLENFRLQINYFPILHLQYFPSHFSPYVNALYTRYIVCGFSDTNSFWFWNAKEPLDPHIMPQLMFHIKVIIKSQVHSDKDRKNPGMC